MYSLFEYEVSKRFGGLVGWGIGVALFALMYTSFYPQAGEQFAELNMEDIAFYQAFGSMNLATFAGYLTSTIFSFVPLIIGIYAILAGTHTIGGEDDDGTLEMIVALPLRRWQVLLAKALALNVTFCGILLIGSAGIVGGYLYAASAIEVDLELVDLVPVVANILPVTLFFVMFSLLLGAYLPSRRAASLTMTVVLIVSYFGNNLLGLVEPLAGLRRILPFYYYDASVTVFSEGVAPADVAVLLLAAAVCLLLALLSFQRRDITVGAWPFRG